MNGRTLSLVLTCTYMLILLVLVLPTTRIEATNQVVMDIPPLLAPVATVAAETTSTELEATHIAQERTETKTPEPVAATSIPVVPFYSQFADITRPEWKKISCGIASVAMLIDHYQEAVLPDTLLEEGIAAGAYIQNAGWSHAGLIGLAKKHGLTGEAVPLAHLSMPDAFAALEGAVAEGPVIVSVHYTFDPQNLIPHLVVVTGVSGGLVHYNDPAEDAGGGTVSVTQFQSAWKKRYISIRPTS